MNVISKLQKTAQCRSYNIHFLPISISRVSKQTVLDELVYLPGMDAHIKDESPDFYTSVWPVDEDAAYRYWTVGCYFVSLRGIVQETTNLKEHIYIRSR